MTRLRVAQIVARTAVEGPFERAAIWVQGCSLACPGCCNPELFEPGGGALREVDELLAELAAGPAIEGITVLGGEPLEQLEGVAALAEGAAAAGLGVIVFTGFELGEARMRPGFDRLWAAIDTLVDGPYRRREPERARRFIGSRNQGLRHRSRRYADPQLWRGQNGAELHIGPDGRMQVHGFPVQTKRLLRLLRELEGR